MFQMNRLLSWCITLAFTFILSPFSFCQGADRVWPFIFDRGRLVVKSTPKELSEAKTILARVDEKHIPADMLGGVLFDGKVTERLLDDKFGQSAWMIKPTHFMLGSDKVREDHVAVVSPRIEDGGVILNVGEKYRIFTVNIEGRFYIWKAVVIELGK